MQQAREVRLSPESAEHLLTAHFELLGTMWDAVWDFQVSPQEDSRETVDVFVEKLSTLFHFNHSMMRGALRDYGHGETEDMIHCARVAHAIRRMMDDLDRSWMTEDNRETIDRAVTGVVDSSRWLLGY